MKQNFCEEFDINEVYRKLITPCKPLTTKVNEFFEEPKPCSLCALQEKIAKIEYSIYERK